ncbi:MAG: M15 family metallopeptidase [Deltaproteobacteria bacterium]|nr:M15 family metallopeptidase [Deltaproteobacteria bacterium]
MLALFALMLAQSPAAPFGPGLVDVGERIPTAHVALGYSTPDNFLHKDVYGELERCFLVEDAARMLADAHVRLQQRAPGVTFVLYDCARPKSVQLVMWDAVAGTKQQGYVANPHKPPGSVHNRGCAVDLSLWDSAKQAPLDMGTPWDFFGALAEPRRESDLWKEGKLTSEQLANRLLLREVMLRAGFGLLPHEWWHFDCAPPGIAAKRYPILP